MSQFVSYILSNPKAIRKFLVALTAALGTIITVWTTGQPADVITGPEWIMVVLSFLGALGVYAVPNETI